MVGRLNITVDIGGIELDNCRPLVLIAGPCQLESRDHALMVADRLADITNRLGIGFIFKSSYDKANRTSVDGMRGPGIDEGLSILEAVRGTIGCPVLTDVHDTKQCRQASASVDALQIPAFLCRQTDLLMAAGETGKPVNVKKGQFMAPWDMAHVINKIMSTGNRNILLCERGSSFGYNTLVTDMRSIPVLAKSGHPVVIDATHAVQQPGGRGSSSGGQREYAPVIARAAIAVGVAGLFMETHEQPDRAPSDGANMISLADIEGILEPMIQIDRIAKKHPVEV